MASPLPPPNETTHSRFIDFVRIMRQRLVQDGAPRREPLCGAIEPIAFGAALRGSSFRYVQGLHAEFEFMDRAVDLVRLELPTGFFSYVAFRHIYRNAPEPYMRPFQFVPFQYIKTPTVIMDASQRQLEQLAHFAEDAVARWPIAFAFFHPPAPR